MSEVQAGLEEKASAVLETLASWKVRYLDPSGFECQLSLEADTGSEVLKKAEAAIAYLEGKKCQPLSLAFSNGKNHGAEANSQPVPVSTAEGQPKKLCQVHGVEMTLWQKGDRRWFSHRWNGHWCKGSL